MSVAAMCQSGTFTLQRSTQPRKDGSGGAYHAFTPVTASTSVLGDLQSTGSNVQSRFNQQNLVTTYNLCSDQDIGAMAGDRVTMDDTDRVFLVRGHRDASAGRGVLFITDLEEQAH